MKYDFGAMMNIVNSVHQNVQSLISHNNLNHKTATVNENLIDVNIFPSENYDQLKVVEDQIDYMNYRNKLVDER